MATGETLQCACDHYTVVPLKKKETETAAPIMHKDAVMI